MNYRIFFSSDKLIPVAIANTLYYATISVPLTTVLSLGAALLLNREVWGIRIFRSIFYLPNVISVVAVTMLWQFLFQSKGLINSILGIVGNHGPNWLTDPSVSKLSLVIMDTWFIGGSMIIYLAGLQGIPGIYYEAAEIDGAGPIRRFFFITLPMLAPSILYNPTMGMIGALQTFSQSFIMTNGGPANSTTFYMIALYRRAFSDMRMGYACAMAWMLLVPTAMITYLVFAVFKRWAYYEVD